MKMLKNNLIKISEVAAGFEVESKLPDQNLKGKYTVVYKDNKIHEIVGDIKFTEKEEKDKTGKNVHYKTYMEVK